MEGLTSWAEGVAADVGDQLREFFGGAQGGISWDSEGGISGGVAFGERRVLSWQALVLAFLAGMAILAVLDES